MDRVRLKDKHRKDEMEENIAYMIDNLLREDDEPEIITEGVMANKVNEEPLKSTPMICINNVPFTQSPSFFNFQKQNSMNSNKPNLLQYNFDNPNKAKKRHSMNEISYNMSDFPNVGRVNENPLYSYPSWHKSNSDHSNSSTASLGVPDINSKMKQIKIKSDLEEVIEVRIKSHERIDEESAAYLKGNFVSIIKSQNGSRVLQKSFNKTSKEIMSLIFYEIKLELHELMVDSYANYFCQRFYDFLDFSEKIEFLLIIKSHVVDIGNSNIGTYPLQAVIDQMKTKEEKLIIIESVSGRIIEMAENAQGTHVIEKMILSFEEESIREIYDTILSNFMHLATHANGLCVVKKLICCTKSIAVIKFIQGLLIENMKTLLYHQNGNFCFQVAIESWNTEFYMPIVHLFFGQFYSLSIMKYSSNVIEKCLEKGDDIVVNKFMEEICHKSKVTDLMKNPYGNYVIQKALKMSTGFYRGKVVGFIKKNIEKFTDKKLANKWSNILNNQNNSGLFNMSSDGSFTMSGNNSPRSSNSNLSNLSARSMVDNHVSYNINRTKKLSLPFYYGFNHSKSYSNSPNNSVNFDNN